MVNAIILALAVMLVFAGCNREQPALVVNTPPPLAVTPSPSNTPARHDEIEITKDNITAAKPAKKAINVKLKRSFKGEYSWDIVGTDIKEIIKINRELQKEFPN
ncbi:MAG: hypothetical protein HQL01_15835 [Nitrospirae bacterium]|uniref:Lipoprotein n=1 Tax=uncultured Nitrospirae bacterium MY4-5C TaxID=798580 RepID=D9MP74_9BACT|nr:hypothetical protein LW5_0050 [uncultured Nitrospirae bacterium MY4-5C]MBF0321260.1 hypothetical protein [Nitrospirota bacterium]